MWDRMAMVLRMKDGLMCVCVWGGVIIQFYLLLYMFEVNLHNKK